MSKITGVVHSGITVKDLSVSIPFLVMFPFETELTVIPSLISKWNLNPINPGLLSIETGIIIELSTEYISVSAYTVALPLAYADTFPNIVDRINTNNTPTKIIHHL